MNGKLNFNDLTASLNDEDLAELKGTVGREVESRRQKPTLDDITVENMADPKKMAAVAREIRLALGKE